MREEGFSCRLVHSLCLLRRRCDLRENCMHRGPAAPAVLLIPSTAFPLAGLGELRAHLHTLTRTHSNKTRDHLQLCKIRVIQICKPDALIHIHARMHAKVLYLGPMNPKFRAASRFLMHRISLHFIPQFDFGGGNISILKPGLGASRSAADVALEKRLRGLMRTGKIASN